MAHILQLNLDVTIKMQCSDLHVNVQDAAGDRIAAGEALRKDETVWTAYAPRDEKGRGLGEGEWEKRQYAHEEDVHDYLGAARGRRKFKGTPRLRRGEAPDACRIYGSLEGNKVQGDFHITARGHGYMDFGGHLDHSSMTSSTSPDAPLRCLGDADARTAFNFTHHISELSFGPFFPSLHNPLDATTSEGAPSNFYKYQYYLSLVPTIYTDKPHRLPHTSPPSPRDSAYNPYAFAPHTIYTNQYAVTEQNHIIGEQGIPGIFVKYDIEPILLMVSEEWGGVLGLGVRIVNLLAGVLVAGGWVVGLLEWAGELAKGKRGLGRRSGAGDANGLLNTGEKEGLD